MKIGDHDVDSKLFEMYVRAIIVIRVNPFEECYEQSRWDLHCRILDVVVSAESPEEFVSWNDVEVLAFNDALRAEVDLYLTNVEQ